MLTYSIIAGLVFGLHFCLAALGLNLIFGVMRIVNLAHGDFLMLGAFATFWLYSALHVHPLVTVPIALVGFVIIGIPLYYLLVPQLLKAKDPEMLSIILFFGLSQVIEAVATISFGPSDRSIPGRVLGTAPVHAFGQNLPSAWIVSGAVSAVAVVCLYFYLYRTRLGRLTRAVMAQRDEALATGINVHRVSAIAFGVGLALALIAGLIGADFAWHVSVFYPETVFSAEFSVFALVFALFGGVATVTGPVLGVLLLYGLYNAIGISTPQYFQLIYGILIVLLVLFLPNGLVSLWRRRGVDVP